MQPKKWTHTQCFAHYGTKPTNIQWSWSAVNKKTKTAVLTCWDDGFSNAAYRMDHPADKPAFKEFVEHMHYAQRHCDGVICVIMAKAQNARSGNRKIIDCWPAPAVKLKIKSLDENTGRLVASVV